MFMFMDKSDPLNFGEQFAARQREKDIASKGFSTIKAPKNMKRLKKIPKDLIKIKEQVEEEIVQQDALLRGISNRIHHRANLALRKLAAKDQTFAISAMRSILEQQQEYIQITVWKRTLQVYLHNLHCGLASSKNPKKDMKQLRLAHKEAEKPPMPEYKDQQLLQRLQKKDLFPLVHFNEGSPYHVLYSDTPPFCNHDVAQERAKEIASKGYTNINIPTGYTKREKPTMRMVPSIRLVRAGIHEQEEALQKLILRIQEISLVAMELKNNGAQQEAATEMRAIRELQHAYLHHSQIIEGYKAYENHLMYGLVNVNNSEQDLLELKNTTPNYKASKEETDEDLMVALKERKFFPKVFPLLGQSGVKLCYSENPPVIGTKKSWDTKSDTASHTSNTTRTTNIPGITSGMRSTALLAQ